MEKFKISEISFKPFPESLFPFSYFSKANRNWINSPGMAFVFYLLGVILAVHVVLIAYLIKGETNWIISPFLLISNFEGDAAIVLFSLSFILASRLYIIESLFGGLDRLYKAHALLGGVGFFLLIMHVLLRLIDAGLNWDILSLYLIPGKYMPYTYGLLGFLLFCVLMFLTKWVKIPYQLWLWTHKFMGLAFILGGLHAWLSVSAFSEFQPYRTVLVIFWGLGTIAFFYKWIFYDYFGPKFDSIVDMIRSNGNITEIYLKIADPRFRFHTGQFVFIKAAETKNNVKKESHPFSISGFYNGNILRISAKKLGDFTSTLPNLTVGDKITIVGPYGKFGNKILTSKKDVIWIAGGIGISPFLQMLQHENINEVTNHVGRKIDFFTVVKDKNEDIYSNEIMSLSEAMPNLQYFRRYSNIEGRLTADDVIKALGHFEDIKNRNIFICGPIAMMRDLSQQFQALGVKPGQIIFEEFQLG